MSKPPIDPRDRRTEPGPTNGRIVVAYGLMAAILATVGLISYPLLAAAAIAGTAGLSLLGRHTLQLYRCLRSCGGFAIDVGDSLQVCITRPAATC